MVKDIFREIMGCLKSGTDIFHKRGIQTYVVNSHTVTYKPIAPADNSAKLEFNFSGHSDYYIDLNSVRLHLRIKFVKTDGSDIESAKANIVGCVYNLLHSMLSCLSVSLNGKPVTFHEPIYYYKAYLENLLNYGSDASGTHVVSSLWYLDSFGDLKDNRRFTKRLNYFSNGNTLELYGRLHADLLNSDKMLINGVDMKMKLT